MAKKKEDPIPQRDKIVKAVLDSKMTFWRDADGEAFATVPRAERIERYRVRSTASRNIVRGIYGDAFPSKLGTPGAISDTAWREARPQLEAIAFRGPARSPEVRLHRDDDGAIWIDLGDPTWRLVRVDRNGWLIVDKADVPLIRPDGLRPMFEPCRASADILGRFGELWNIRPVRNRKGAPAALILIVSWEMATLYPIGPYAVLAIDGEAGSGKSTFCRQLRRLGDPNIAPHRATPRNEDDLIIAARNGRIVGFDNVSRLSEEMADAICRLATGAGFGKRRLYTDDEEHIVSVARSVLLNGIPSLLMRSDLANRALAVTLPTIPDEARLPEEELRQSFEAIAPKMLGLLLDGLTTALRRLSGLKLPALPRMADYAWLACAAAPAFGWTEKDVLEAIKDSGATAVTAIVEGDRVAGAVQTLVRTLAEDGDWKGTATELLDRLDNLVSDTVRRAKAWPKDATRLSGRLRRLAAALRAVGIAIDLDNRDGHGGERIITITRKTVDRGFSVSAASAKPKDKKTQGPLADAADTEACFAGAEGRNADAEEGCADTSSVSSKAGKKFRFYVR